MASNVNWFRFLSLSQLYILRLRRWFICALSKQWKCLSMNSSDFPRFLFHFCLLTHFYGRRLSLFFLCDSAVSHRAVFFEQGPSDELQQRQEVDQPFLLQAQQTQHLTQLVALHTTNLQTHITHFSYNIWCCFAFQKVWHQWCSFLLMVTKSTKTFPQCFWTFGFLVSSPQSPYVAPSPTPWSLDVPLHWHHYRLYIHVLDSQMPKGSPSAAKEAKSVSIFAICCIRKSFLSQP